MLAGAFLYSAYTEWKKKRTAKEGDNMGEALLTVKKLKCMVLSVLLEWFYPIRGWKVESDLWHHPQQVKLIK